MEKVFLIILLVLIFLLGMIAGIDFKERKFGLGILYTVCAVLMGLLIIF